MGLLAESRNRDEYAANVQDRLPHVAAPFGDGELNGKAKDFESRKEEPSQAAPREVPISAPGPD